METVIQVFAAIGIAAVGGAIIFGLFKLLDWVDDVNFMDGNLDEAMDDIMRLNRQASAIESRIHGQNARIEALEKSSANRKK